MTDKDKHYEKYGWKVNEENLKTLPPSAPQEAQDLTTWLTLNGRKKSLVEYLGLETNGKVHPKFWHIGAWTHRMSHSNPNCANIPSVFRDTPRNAVEEVKHKYDGSLRELWYEPGYLVGTDAEGIQLRVLAHLMGSEKYIKAVSEGRSEDKTDIHNLNKDALGPICRHRDAAKTYIYAWILGASIPKQAEILSCTPNEAKEAEKRFLQELPELKKLKDVQCKLDADRGYFYGLDGRKVFQKSKHLMLAGYLQNGESVIMKMATLDWTNYLRNNHKEIEWYLRNFVHDEWQTGTSGSYKQAETIGMVQCKSLELTGEKLGLLCPLKGKSKVGTNWKETH